ncbi:MAG: hypothetical protein FJ284_03895 [Planctomycetes bacterium]|nr:hypothetical protein [Planctomycetota bacterium]
MKALAVSFASLPSRPRLYLCRPPAVLAKGGDINERTLAEEILPAVDEAAAAAAGELAEICWTGRWAHRQLGYTVPVPGRYELVLVFAETNPNFFGLVPAF